MIYNKNYQQALIGATGFASLFCECYEDSMKQGGMVQQVVLFTCHGSWV